MATVLIGLAVVLLSTVTINLIGKVYKIEKAIKAHRKVTGPMVAMLASYILCDNCTLKHTCPAAFTGADLPCEGFNPTEEFEASTADQEDLPI